MFSIDAIQKIVLALLAALSMAGHTVVVQRTMPAPRTNLTLDQRLLLASIESIKRVCAI